MKLEEKLLEQYFDVIGKNGNTENQIQEFLEENTIFIPMPFLLNHYLHMNCVISKFKLGNEFVTDFAYLTSNTTKDINRVVIRFTKVSKILEDLLKDAEDNVSIPKFELIEGKIQVIKTE